MQHFPLQSEFSEFLLFCVFSHFCTGGGSARLKTTSPRMRAPCAHHARTSRPQAPQARQETSHEHQRPSHRAPKPAPKAPNRPRRSQIGPEGAKPSPKAPNRPRRRHIGAEGAKPSQKAPSRHTKRQIGPEGAKSARKAPSRPTRKSAQRTNTDQPQPNHTPDKEPKQRPRLRNQHTKVNEQT